MIHIKCGLFDGEKYSKIGVFEVSKICVFKCIKMILSKGDFYEKIAKMEFWVQN